MPPLLRVENLRIHREQTHILRDVSWTVEKGQHWVILGPNGSGKTSLLGALNGSLFPTSGEVRVLGKCFGAHDWRELRRHIGLVSAALAQQIGETETALDVVLGGPRAMINVWGDFSPKEIRHARLHLRRVGLAALAGRPWGVLSQGERQRVLIARALSAEPALLILDEPCAGLDPVAREHFLLFLDSLGRTRRSPGLILVTHHVEEIMPVFTHGLLLRTGQVQARGDMAEVLTSINLRETFGQPMKLTRQNGRYRLRL